MYVCMYVWFFLLKVHFGWALVAWVPALWPQCRSAISKEVDKDLRVIGSVRLFFSFFVGVGTLLIGLWLHFSRESERGDSSSEQSCAGATGAEVGWVSWPMMWLVEAIGAVAAVLRCGSGGTAGPGGLV